MAKPLGFKDFINVDYAPGQDNLIKYNAVKRKRGVHKEESIKSEANLSISQRRARAIRMKRLSPRIKIARQRALKRTANMQTIQKRANKQARNFLFQRISKGKSRDELAPARRQEIEKRLDKLKPAIDRYARKILPSVRKQEIDRKGPKNND